MVECVSKEKCDPIINKRNKNWMSASKYFYKNSKNYSKKHKIFNKNQILFVLGSKRLRNKGFMMWPFCKMNDIRLFFFSLSGTATYGVASADFQANTTFSIDYSKCTTGEFLFATGDFSMWVIVSMDYLHRQVYTSSYNTNGEIIGTVIPGEFSITVGEFTLYAENPSMIDPQLIRERKGSNVFIRHCEHVYTCNHFFLTFLYYVFFCLPF